MYIATQCNLSVFFAVGTNKMYPYPYLYPCEINSNKTEANVEFFNRILTISYFSVALKAEWI